MRNKITNIWSLSLQMLITLLMLSVGLLAGFLALAWFKGSLKLPEFLAQPASNVAPTSLTIHVTPADAQIMLNDQPYNPNSNPLPGDYLVRATREGFLAVEETIRIHPDQKNEVNLHLIPIVKLQQIAQDASEPGWDRQGDLFYFNSYESKICKWETNVVSQVVEIPGALYQLSYSPAGTQAIAFSSLGEYDVNKLFRVNLLGGELIDVPLSGFAGLGPDGETVWGINDNSDEYLQKTVWSLAPGGNPKFIALDNTEWASAGDQILIDPTGQWLAIKSPKGVAIWEIATAKMVASFEKAIAPLWVQAPQSGLVYVLEDKTLNFAPSNLNWSSMVLVLGVQAPVASRPGSSEIVFSRYNPFSGGASFWAVDARTMSVRLLSEAGIETGRIEQFSISLDGKKLAFVNHKDILYLVTFEH